MKKHRKSRLITTVFLLAALGGIPAMIGFVNRSVSENPIFLGLSPARLFVFIGMVLATVAFFLLSLFTRKKELVDFPISRKHFTVFTTSFLVLMVISYLLCFVPRYNLGLYADLLENLRPIFFWALGIFLLFILAFCIGQFGLHPDFLLSYLTVHRRTWVTSLAAAGFMIVIAGAGIALKVLEYRKEDFWYGAGVPLLIRHIPRRPICYHASNTWEDMYYNFAWPNKSLRLRLYDVLGRKWKP